jgi:hypothetical protein
MSVQINKDITTVQVEIPKTNVAIENAITEIIVQTSTPQITISTAGVNGKDGITQDTSSLATTGSNIFTGDEIISGSLFVSGATELGGDIFPQTPHGATLGTLEKPFREIFVQSGSINIASDISGEPNTSLSNIGGNILVSAGGMRLIGDASFVAATGSFNYISGSLTQVGNYERFGNTILIGDQITTGSLLVSGSTIMVGDNTMAGNTSLTGSVNISGSTTFTGVHSLSGSNTIVGNTLMTGTNTIIGNTELSGSINVSGSSNFHNSIFIVTGSSYFTGSHEVKGNSIFSGSINIASGSSYYRAGNKLFNYGQWGSLQTQTGSANTAYPMKLETQFGGAEGIRITNNGSGFPTRLIIDNTGLYNIQFSVQLHTTSTEACDFSIWFVMTGSNMANSNTDFSIEKVAGGGFTTAALNFMTPITAGEYVELYWSKTTNNGQLQYKGVQTAPIRPATPSIIVTVTQVA